MWHKVVTTKLIRKAEEETGAYGDLKDLWDDYSDSKSGDLVNFETDLSLDRSLPAETRHAMINDALALKAKEAMDLVIATGSEDRFFGSNFSDTLGGTYHGKEGENIGKMAKMEVEMAKELRPVLHELFKWSPKIKTSIDKYLMVKGNPQPDGYTPIRWLPSFFSLVNYFTELNLATSGVSRRFDNDYTQSTSPHTTLPTSWLRERAKIQKEIFSPSYNPKEGEEANDKINETVALTSPAYGGNITTEKGYQDMLNKIDTDLKKIHSGEGKDIRSSVTVDVTKDIYKVANGQKINDPIYGAGIVTSIANLEHGFVSVAFEPGIAIEFYDAANIAAPVQEAMPSFQCPMDCATITSESCLNGPKGACGYLQFMDDKPSCEFNKACDKTKADKAVVSESVAKEVADKNAQDEIVKERLVASLKSASFMDHDFYKIQQYTRVATDGIVRKKNSSFYGKVLERHADSSISVAWFNGPTSTAWESEIEAIDAETVQKLKAASII